jgi:hypothetical protein
METPNFRQRSLEVETQLLADPKLSNFIKNNNIKFPSDKASKFDDATETVDHGQLKQDVLTKYQDTILEFIKSGETTIKILSVPRVYREQLYAFCAERNLFAKSVGRSSTKGLVVSTKSILLNHVLADIPTKQIENIIVDFRLPIPCLSEPELSFWIEYLDKSHGTRAIFDSFLSAVNYYGVSNFIGYRKGLGDFLKNKVTKDNASALEAFIKDDSFKLADVQKRVFDHNVKLCKFLYSTPNAGKYFVALDMSSASFNVVKMFNPKLVLDAETWPELCEKIGAPSYVAQNKQLRLSTIQKVFGKKTKTMWETMILTLCEKLFENGNLMYRY